MRQSDPAPLAPDEQISDTFPLSRWAKLAELLRWAELAEFLAGLDAAYGRAADLAQQSGTRLPDDAAGSGWGGFPLPKGIRWDTYSVELIERRAHPEDSAFGGSWSFEGGEPDDQIMEDNPDGSLRKLSPSGRVAWQHVRTVIRHPDAIAVLQWEWVRGTPIGRISIVGLETDPDPDLSCRLLTKAIPLLRDYEWQGQRKSGRPPLTDDAVRRDLEDALGRCRKRGVERPSLSQLADAHDNPGSDTGALSERALRDRMRDHPQPFRELTPWIRTRPRQ